MADVMQPQQHGQPHQQDAKLNLSPPQSLSPNNASTTNSNASNANANTSNNASRRPPRKSTLTQQQKNQKRQRATQDQLMTLEVEFNKNPTPTALVRERIASEINMTERSVQIWFQNRCEQGVFIFPVHANIFQARQDKEHCEAKHRKRRRLR